jgi:uncharacterized repeat protein (TIGR01451 family)
MRFRSCTPLFLILLATLLPLAVLPAAVRAVATTYYVSNDGDDGQDGRSPDNAWATVGRVNAAGLQPGDRVLFACDDEWQGEMLKLTASGQEGSPITIGSYPEGCADKPVLSGAQPIAGWAHHSGNLYVADLGAGANAGHFPHGTNQLFRGEQRLPHGRWPNPDEGDAGYATIDGQPVANQITDDQLPAGDWTGAVAHIRGMRWYILNREVSGQAGQTLILGHDAECWGGCGGWGYFLNNHLNTLDREGEWYYDAATQRIYLYTGGAPSDVEIEGSAILLVDDDRSWGGVTLGEDLLGQGISYVVVENLDLRRWWRHGIALPTNFAHYEPHHLTLRDNDIRDVDGIGINLATWVWDAWDGRPDGWRGGYDLTVSGNQIEVANRMGINTNSRDSLFADNVIRDVGLIENLGAAGMGCGLDASGGYCTEDGDGLRIKVDKGDDSGHHNTLTGNRLERIAYNGMDVFGHHNTFEHNVIRQACYAKGDCGGVRTFGSGSLGDTTAHDLRFEQNLILDTVGNTDGCHDDYKALFGFGLYIDHGSRDVTISGNTIVSSTVHGILYQNSTGTVTDNTLYYNSRTWDYGAQVRLGGSPAELMAHSGNVLYGLGPTVRTLALNDPGRLSASDGNYFFNPYRAAHIYDGADKTLAQWQAASGKDGSSQEAWFSLSPGEEPRSRIWINDTATTQVFALGSSLYLDLGQQPVSGSLSLPPYSSQVLVASGDLANLVLNMALLSAPEVQAGAPLTYTLNVENTGTLAARDVVLSQPLPDEVVDTGWQSSAGGATARPGNRYAWDLPDLAPAETVVLTVTGRYVATLPEDAALLLSAQVETTSPQSSTTGNWAVLLLGAWRKVYLPLIW